MKKFYLMMLACLCTLTSMAAEVKIGYKKTDPVYCYTGFGNTPSDCRMGGAILITKDMYKDYIGAKIVGMNIGWSNPDYSSAGTIFLRKNLTDTVNVLSGKGTLKYTAVSGASWESEYSRINFDNSEGLKLTEDLGDFYVGVYAETVQKGTYALCTSYPANQAGSAYMWGSIEGYDYDDDGNEMWTDYSSDGALSIDLIVSGTFTNKVQLNSILVYPTMTVGEPEDALINVTNKGTNAVSKITMKYMMGEEEYTEPVQLSSSIASGASSTLIVPAYAIGSGMHKVTISKVNGNTNNNKDTLEYQTVGVYADVAEKYQRISLMEFFESENSYYVPRYYDELIIPGLEPYADKVNIVSQHINDQWMTGDDEETQLMLGMADNDSTAVTCPAMSVDRSPNIALYAMGVTHAAPYHDVIYSQFASYLYEVSLSRPTYASIDAECEVQGDKVNVTLTGDIAPDVTDEQLYVTAYLLEDSVYTDSQEQSDVEKGEYYHDNLQRARLTALWGDPIPVKSGQFQMQYQTDLYPDEWKLQDMRVVAFINRGKEGNNIWNRDILNSCACPLTKSDGITDVQNQVHDSRIFDLSGRRVSRPTHGIYIMNGKKLTF